MQQTTNWCTASRAQDRVMRCQHQWRASAASKRSRRFLRVLPLRACEARSGRSVPTSETRSHQSQNPTRVSAARCWKHAVTSSVACRRVTQKSLALSKRGLEGSMRIAVGQGDFLMVEELLAKGADPCAGEDSGLTALHCFATVGICRYDTDALDAVDFDTLTPCYTVAHTNNSLAVYEMSNEAEVQENYTFDKREMGSATANLEKLLKGGADINIRDYQGWTPLHHAAFHGDAVAISALLSHGADIAAECHQGATALHVVAQVGHLQAVRELLSKGAPVAFSIGSLCKGWTPVHCAADNLHVQVMQLLLQRSAQGIVNATDHKGWTPLHVAASRKTLNHDVERYSRPDEVRWRRSEIDAFTYCCRKLHDSNYARDDGYNHLGDDDYEDGLEWSEVDESRYRDVIDKRHLDLHAGLLDAMLQKGANAGARTEQGWTPLHCCMLSAMQYPQVGTGNIGTAQEQDSLWDDHKFQAYMRELQGEVHDKLWWLKQIIKQICPKPWESESAFWDVPVEVAIMSLLTRCCSSDDVNTSDELGRTALHYAAAANITQAIQLLVAKGADVNAKDSKGQTAVYEASQAQQPSLTTVDVLVSLGAKAT